MAQPESVGLGFFALSHTHTCAQLTLTFRTVSCACCWEVYAVTRRRDVLVGVGARRRGLALRRSRRGNDGGAWGTDMFDGRVDIPVAITAGSRPPAHPTDSRHLLDFARTAPRHSHTISILLRPLKICVCWLGHARIFLMGNGSCGVLGRAVADERHRR